MTLNNKTWHKITNHDIKWQIMPLNFEIMTLNYKLWHQLIYELTLYSPVQNYCIVCYNRHINSSMIIPIKLQISDIWTLYITDKNSIASKKKKKLIICNFQHWCLWTCLITLLLHSCISVWTQMTLTMTCTINSGKIPYQLLTMWAPYVSFM